MTCIYPSGRALLQPPWLTAVSAAHKGGPPAAHRVWPNDFHLIVANTAAFLQEVENYEYEMPSDFEDEEIDEDTAFTAEDEKLYAGWFGKKAEASEDEDDEDVAAQLDSDNFDEVRTVCACLPACAGHCLACTLCAHAHALPSRSLHAYNQSAYGCNAPLWQLSS